MGALDLVSFIQSIFTVRGRPLTTGERTILQRIFHESIDYDVIRLVIGASGVYGVFSDRAFVKGNTIYMKDRYPDSTSTEDEKLDKEGLLVHETTHVWQFQNRGTRYISEAVYAQVFLDDAYDWEKEIDQGNKMHWESFNREAQCEFF